MVLRVSEGRRWVVSFAVLALAAGCGRAGLGSASPSATAPSSPSVASPSIASPSVDPCSVDVLLPWFKSFADDPAIDLEIVDVEVEACENGYAHVYAVPYNDPGGAPPQYESEQFWLKLVDGEWTGVASGTGITCSDPDRTPEHAAACDALGES